MQSHVVGNLKEATNIIINLVMTERGVLSMEIHSGLAKLGPIFGSSYSNRVRHNFIFNIVSILRIQRECSCPTRGMHTFKSRRGSAK